ncbi:MAG: ABC transporter substrate-binding protein [Acidimicrobiia bacterium]
MRRQRLSWRFVALLGALALVAAACGGDDSGDTTTTTAAATTTTTAADTPDETTTTTTAPPDAGPKTIIIGTTDSIAGLDSADAYAVHDWELIRNTGEGLTRFDTGTTDVIPGIAESWDVSDDGTVYTFNLRSGLMFFDGTPLTAADYVVHINRMLELDGDGGVGGALGKPYIADVAAPDDTTVVFTLNDAFAYFPQVVTGAPYHPMHPSYPTDALVEFPDAPFGGVGPWVVTEYTLGEQTVLEPNPNYYGDAPGVDRIIITYFESATTLVQELQKEDGGIDIAWRSVQEPGLLDTLANEDGVVSAVVPGGGIRYMILNHNIAPADDVNVRQGVAAAIDRDELVDGPLGGNANPLYSPVPPGFIGSNEAFDTAYEAPNVDLAKELFAKSGYDENNKLQLILDYPPNRYGGVVGDAIQTIATQLEATGVVDVELRATEWATYLGNVIGGESYAFSFLGWFFDYPDSSNYVEPFSLNGGLGTNITDSETGEVLPGLTEKDLIDNILAAATETDTAARAALYGTVQDQWAADVVTIPLWFEPERVFYRDYISGDGGGANPNSLNIGPTTDLNYDVLQTSN